jgi:hypothetical protein
MLPAVPWLTPSLTWSDRVGHGGGPAGPGELAGEAAGAAGADAAGVVAGALLTEAAGAEFPLAPVLEELPHPVAKAATQVSAAAGSARRAARRDEFITISFWLSRLREPCDS